MKILAIIALAVVSFGSAVFAGNTFGPLIATDALYAQLESEAPLILDIRGKAYQAGHIPGAISAPYGKFRGPDDNPGQLVPEDQLEAVLQSLGVNFTQPVAIVHEGDSDSDFGAAARVYWTLKSSGLTQIAILNGGMTAWEAAKLPLDVSPVAPTPSDIDINFSHQWLSETDDVASVVAGTTNATLIDARPEAFFNGRKRHGAATRPGTLPGAQNVAHSIWFKDGGKIVERETAIDIASKLGLKPDQEVVSFCNTGHWAATDWFALSELAEVPNSKLYPDSMVGYSKTDNEMENVPGLLRNLINQIRGN